MRGPLKIPMMNSDLPNKASPPQTKKIQQIYKLTRTSKKIRLKRN